MARFRLFPHARSRRVPAIGLAVAALVLLVPSLAAAGKGSPTLTFTPSPLEIGPFLPGPPPPGAPPRVEPVVLTNTGSAGAGPLTATISNPLFNIVEDRCIKVRLRPGKSCTIFVGYAGSNTLNHTDTGTLTVVSTKPAAQGVVTLLGTTTSQSRIRCESSGATYTAPATFGGVPLLWRCDGYSDPDSSHPLGSLLAATCSAEGGNPAIDPANDPVFNLYCYPT